jgi:hypothetical protein
MIPEKYWDRVQFTYSTKVEHWKISVDSWKKLGEGTMDSWVRAIIENFKLDPNKGSVYEFCCATGIVLGGFKRQGFKVSGCDISEEFIKIGQEEGRDYIYVADAADVELPESCYVIGLDAFEHLPLNSLIKVLGEVNKKALQFFAHHFVLEMTSGPGQEEREVSNYEFYEDGFVPMHYLNKSRAWWDETFSKYLTNMKPSSFNGNATASFFMGGANPLTFFNYERK